MRKITVFIPLVISKGDILQRYNHLEVERYFLCLSRVFKRYNTVLLKSYAVDLN